MRYRRHVAGAIACSAICALVNTPTPFFWLLYKSGNSTLYLSNNTHEKSTETLDNYHVLREVMANTGGRGFSGAVMGVGSGEAASVAVWA